MTELSMQQKREWAKTLYLKENLTQQEIAERVGVSRVTVNNWIGKNGWEMLKTSITITREEQLKNLYRQLTELNNAIMAKPEGERFPNAAEADTISKLSNAIKKMDPDREVKVMSAQGLADCKKMMMMAKAGKYNGYLLEGMACPGGCIAGAGTLADPAKSVAMLNKYKNEATMKVATETPYQDSLDLLHY